MGRAGPARSSCRFLLKSLEGPESRAAALGWRAGGGGLDTWVIREPGEKPWGQTSEGQGWRREERRPGAESHAGSEGARLRPLARLRPAPPSLSPLSSDKAAVSPRPVPWSLSPSLLLGSLFPSSSPSLLPSLLSPDLPRSLSPPLPLSSSLRTSGSFAPPPLGAPRRVS